LADGGGDTVHEWMVWWSLKQEKSYFFNWMVGGEKMFIGASRTLIAPWSNSPAVDPVQKSL
jgi:hypothetical protein